MTRRRNPLINTATEAAMLAQTPSHGDVLTIPTIENLQAELAQQMENYASIPSFQVVSPLNSPNDIRIQEPHELQGISTRSFQVNLTPKQEWLKTQIELQRINPLLGESYVIIRAENGDSIHPDNQLIATLIDLRTNNSSQPGDWRFDLHLIDDRVIPVGLWMIEPTRAIRVPKPKAKELKQLQQSRYQNTLDQTLAVFNAQQNTSHTTLKSEIERYQREVEAAQTRVKTMKASLAERQKKLKTIDSQVVSEKDFLTMIDDINSLDKVETAYLSEQGHLIVITKPLHPVNFRTDEEDPSINLGRYVIRYIIRPTLNVSMESYLNVGNLDYVCSGHYYHPHISGRGICWGINGTDLMTMIKQGELYQLVDFIITFMSTYPHQDGTPYVDYDRWLRDRSPLRENAMATKRYIRELLEQPLINNPAFEEAVRSLGVDGGRDIDPTNGSWVEYIDSDDDEEDEDI